MGERLVVVLPMIGSGKITDPLRPKYIDAVVPPHLRAGAGLAPLKTLSGEERLAAEKTRIGAYSFVLADDGKRAIVEFVARDRAAFAEILKDSKIQGSGVKVYEKGKLAEVLGELRAVKKDFDPSHLRTPGY